MSVGKDSLISEITRLTGLNAQAVEAILVRPKDIAHGDWSFPCFVVAKERKVSPPECAKALAKEIKLPSGYSKVEPVGPYLNFFKSRTEASGEIIKAVLRQKETLGRRTDVGNKTIIVEYSSPNILKPFHLGHMRNNMIGLALERIYKHLGYKVVTFNHLGDYGTQFGIIWAGCQIWGKPKELSVESLVQVYIQAAALKKAQEENKVAPEDKDKPNITETAREFFRRLEANDAEAVAFWKPCVAVAIDYLKEAYAQLEINFDHWKGESFYIPFIPDVEKTLKDSGILTQSRGALGVDLDKKLGFVRVFTEDGRSLYITRDIATAIYRWNEFKPHKNIYVVAAQQSLHFQQLIAIMRLLKHPAAEVMVHVGYGWVHGQSTRSGKGLSINQFLAEAKERALAAYREAVSKRPEGLDENQVAEAVAIGAAAFYFTNYSNNRDLTFSLDEALSFQGDTGPYMQYALARLSSIEEKASENGIRLVDDFDVGLLKEDEAYELVKLIGNFTEVLEKSAAEYETNHLAHYLLDVAKALSRAYRALRVVGEEAGLAQARLALFIATKYVLQVGLPLIGVPAVQKM